MVPILKPGPEFSYTRKYSISTNKTLINQEKGKDNSHPLISFPPLNNLQIMIEFHLFQITFDSFTIGRFVSFTREGCPDGSLQITEGDRPQVGGSWCGSSWGPVIYYSETNSITMSLRLLRLSKDENGFNFDFRMEFKLLRRHDAIVRYGGIIDEGKFIYFLPCFIYLIKLIIILTGQAGWEKKVLFLGG